MNMNTLRPVGLHVAGVVRFACEGAGTEEFRQLDHFEVLGRSYQPRPEDSSEAPKLKAHPMHDKLLEQAATSEADRKLRSIPIKLLFNKPDNNLSARYEAFDTDINRLVCVGDGTNCTRADLASGKLEQTTCNGPDACLYANEAGRACGLRVRLAVQIEGQEDPLSVFEVQSSGIHTYRNFAAKLATIKALTGRLRGVPLSLRLYERGSPAHDYKPFYVADIGLREGITLESLASPAADQPGVGYDALEAALEAMREESGLSLADDLDGGLVAYHPALPVQRDRRPARTPAASSASIESIVATARANAAAAPGKATRERSTEDIVVPVAADAGGDQSREETKAAPPAAKFQVGMVPLMPVRVNAKIDYPPAHL